MCTQDISPWNESQTKSFSRRKHQFFFLGKTIFEFAFSKFCLSKRHFFLFCWLLLAFLCVCKEMWQSECGYFLQQSAGVGVERNKSKRTDQKHWRKMVKIINVKNDDWNREKQRENDSWSGKRACIRPTWVHARITKNTRTLEYP